MEWHIKQYLLDNGMNKQAVEGKTAEKIVELMLRMFTGKYESDETEQMLDDTISEKKALISELECKANGLRNEISENKTLIEEIQKMLSPKAKESLALYKSLVDVGIKAHADPDVAVKNAGFAMYAYLGGQARTIITDDYEE